MCKISDNNRNGNNIEAPEAASQPSSVSDEPRKTQPVPITSDQEPSRNVTSDREPKRRQLSRSYNLRN